MEKIKFKEPEYLIPREKLVRVYKWANKKFFDNELPNDPGCVKWQMYSKSGAVRIGMPFPSRLTKAIANCASFKVSGGGVVCEISFNPKYHFTEWGIKESMVHEMIHVWQAICVYKSGRVDEKEGNGGHGDTFWRKYQEIEEIDPDVFDYDHHSRLYGSEEHHIVIAVREGRYAFVNVIHPSCINQFKGYLDEHPEAHVYETVGLYGKRYNWCLHVHWRSVKFSDEQGKFSWRWLQKHIVREIEV